MTDRKAKKIIAAAGLIGWIALMLAIIVIAAVPLTNGRNKTAKHYDINCLTQPIKNPLQDCEVKE